MSRTLEFFSRLGAPRTILVTLTLVAAGLMTGAASSQSALRCESTDGQRHECRFDGTATVQLAQRLSRSECVEGQSWGVAGNTIWVDRGCRAEFTLAARSDQNRGGWNTRPSRGNDNRQRENRNITVTCESRDGRRHRCAADTLGQVTLGRQLTRDNRCVEGRTWGYDSEGIWVDRGCRAEFDIADNGGTGRDHGRSQAMRTFACESKASQRTNCAADTRFGVIMTREMSDNRCVLNRTWGSNADGVWVSNGCRAEFSMKTRM